MRHVNAQCSGSRVALSRTAFVMSWIVLEAMNQDSWSSVCSRATCPHTGWAIAKL